VSSQHVYDRHYFIRGEQYYYVGEDKRHFSLIKEKREGLFWRGQKTLALHEEEKVLGRRRGERQEREREKGFSPFFYYRYALWGSSQICLSAVFSHFFQFHSATRIRI
jgi:hypothetical protein